MAADPISLKQYLTPLSLGLVLLCLALPVYAATDANLKTQLATLESGLIRQGRPTDPITKILGSGTAGLTDELRAFFFVLERDQMPIRKMKSYYDDAGKRYDKANKKLLDGLAAYNAGDYQTAQTNLVQAKAEIQLMRQNIESGISLFPQVAKVSYTLFISDAAIAPVKLAGGIISFLVPISDSAIHYAANPDGTLSSEVQNVVVAEFLQTVSLGVSKYLIEDPVNKTVGKSFIWKSLGDTQKEEIKQEIMRRIAEDSNILADKALIDPVKTYVENVINNALDSQRTSVVQEQKSSGFFSGLLQAIARPFRFVGNKIKNLFSKNVSANNSTSETTSAKADVSESGSNSDTASPQKSSPDRLQEDKNAATSKLQPPTQKLSQQEGVITSLVLSPDGQPVYQARFRLVDSKGNNPDTYEARSTAKDGKLEMSSIPNGRYTLTISCGMHCMFGDEFATTIADDIYARWSRELAIDINKSQIDLGKVVLKKWTKVTFALGHGFDPFISIKIVDDKGQEINTGTVVYSSGKYSVSMPDGTYTLKLDESYYKVVEKTFSVDGGTLDLGTFVMEKR